MPMTLIETIDSHHRGLLRALEQVEELASTPESAGELAAAIEAVRHSLLAHEVTAGQFLVGPLRHLRLLDDKQLDALGDELDQLSREAVRLASGEPDLGAITTFVLEARRHIERKARAVAAAARAAIAEGRLPAVPRWYVDEVYDQQGGPGARPPEEWLG